MILLENVQQKNFLIAVPIIRWMISLVFFIVRVQYYHGD